MANNAKVMDSIKNFLLKMKSLDEAIPEELAEDALAMTEEVKDALSEVEVEDADPVETEDSESCGTLEAKVEDAMVKVLHKYGLIKDSSMSALDEMEEKLMAEDADPEEATVVNDEDGEEEVTTDPEKMNDAAIRNLIRSVKPAIASIKDSKQRKIVADSFVKALKMNTGDNYGVIKKAASKKAADSMKKEESQINMNVDYSNVGMDIAKKWNPHYKEV